MDKDHRIMIPGSGIAGAIRGLHETLSNSCLRIIDLGYRPVHRHTVTSGLTQNIVMAVIEKVEDGLPTHVTLCTDTVWIRHDELLLHAESEPWRTGDHLMIPDTRIRRDDASRRRVVVPLTADAPATPGDRLVRDNQRGAWVLLITDTKARSGQQAWFAAGRLGNKILTLTDTARTQFARALEGADDMIKRERKGVHDGFIDVRWPPEEDNPSTSPGPIVGRRWLVTNHVPQGLPVWVEVNADKVTSLRLSQAWRFIGHHTVGDRLPIVEPNGTRAWTPCTSSDLLCPSCQLLGSAGDDDHNPQQLGTRQESYAGHVRFLDALATGRVSTVAVKRAPLASPRPSAGQFYLDNNGAAGKTADLPLAHWGEPGDKPDTPRPIRGRKYYWATTPSNDSGIPRHPHRGIARTHQSPQLVDDVHLIPAGTLFTTRITFDGVSTTQLGGLLAAIEPRHLWPDLDDATRQRIVTRLGGGKPFGWGAVSMAVSNLVAHSAVDRYLGRPPGAVAADNDTVRNLIAQFARTCDRPTLEALRNVLTLNYVPDGDVWYPPGLGEPGAESYDEGFDFWKNSAGLQFRNKRRPLVTLPSPTARPTDQFVSSREEQR